MEGQNISEIFDGIQEEKLDDVLKDYISVLAERYPFSLDLKIDERYVTEQLAELWPSDAEWTAQAFDLWEKINTIIHNIPGITGTPDVILRLAASTSPLTPKDLPDPNEIGVVAVFNSTNGMMRHSLISPLQELDLETLTIPAGLMMVCQPLLRAAEKPSVDSDDDQARTRDDKKMESSKQNTAPPPDVKTETKSAPQPQEAQNNSTVEAVHLHQHEPPPVPQPS